MKNLLLSALLFALATPVVFGQEDAKYLAGAVPEEDGKVVFQREYDLTGMSAKSIYDVAASWIDQRMKAGGQGGRVVVNDESKGLVAGMGADYLVFKSSALSLDRSLMSYLLSAECSPGKCLLKMERIRYAYEDHKYPAEEYISDEIALNKKKTDIYRGYKKFRVHTIDFVNDMFASAAQAFGRPVTTQPMTVDRDQVLGGRPDTQPITVDRDKVLGGRPDTQPITVDRDKVLGGRPDTQPITVDAEKILAGRQRLDTPVSLDGYRRIEATAIPGNIIKMLNDDWMLITAGTDQKFNMMTASWGGLGVLYGKPVAICFINPARYTYQIIEKDDHYTFTFYTPAYRNALEYCGSHSGRNEDKVKGSGLTPVTLPSGAKAFSEAWLIIECKKMVAMSITPEAIMDDAMRAQWTKNPLHKMYIGEILNVWVK